MESQCDTADGGTPPDEAKPCKLRRFEFPSGSADQPSFADYSSAPEHPNSTVHTRQPPLTEAQLLDVATNKEAALQRATRKREQNEGPHGQGENASEAEPKLKNSKTWEGWDDEEGEVLPEENGTTARAPSTCGHR